VHEARGKIARSKASGGSSGEIEQAQRIVGALCSRFLVEQMAKAVPNQPVNIIG
jgi:hypothetical protein